MSVGVFIGIVYIVSTIGGLDVSCFLHYYCILEVKKWYFLAVSFAILMHAVWLLILSSMSTLSDTNIMSKQEIKECFHEVLEKASCEMKKQTECYKDMLN